MKSNTYVPESVVFVVRTAFVAVFVSVTVAPDISRPPGSVTVPRMVDVPVWLHDRKATEKTKRRKAKSRRLRIVLLRTYDLWLDRRRVAASSFAKRDILLRRNGVFQVKFAALNPVLPSVVLFHH